jgi:hypothetical protein
MEKEHFQRAAKHHVVLTKRHRAIAAAAEKARGVAKSAKSDLQGVDLEALDQFLETFIEEHSAISDEHVAMAEHYAQCAKTAEKAEGDEMNKADRLVPTNVSAVAPTPPGIRAVPRAGSAPLPVRDPNDPFVKIIGIDEESQHSPEPSLR